MQSRKFGRIVVGVAGTTGTGSLGFAVLRVTSGQTMAAGMWAALAASLTMSSLVAILGLVLEYRLGKLEAEARAAAARRAADLRQARLELHRSVLDKTPDGLDSARAYRTMAAADALYLSVERNGSRLEDQTHARLYGPQPPAA
jgi:hypothetical protein